MADLEKGSTETSTVETGEVVEKTYTQEEVNAMLQQEGDRRVSSARKKWENEMESRMAEAEKLRNMDENQRKEYEYAQRVQELEQKEHEFAITQNKLEATKVLANRGLPVEFVDYLVAEDAETMLNNINVFDRAFKAAVADEVAKKISTPAPMTGYVKQTGLTVDDFRKMSVSQLAQLKSTNPDLYNTLRNKK